MKERSRRIFSWLLVCVLALGIPQAALARTEYLVRVGETDTYEGQMEEGLRSGFGILRYVDGTAYYGEFAKGKLTGIGIIAYREDEESGAIHRSGTFVDSKANGENVILLKDGRRYTTNYEMGEIVAGFRSEILGSHEWKERLELPQGAWYMGEVETGTDVPGGYGVRFDADGGIYAGTFVQGKRSGQGIYMDAYHNSVAGVWEDDLLLEANRTVYVDDTHPLDWVFKPEAKVIKIETLRAELRGGYITILWDPHQDVAKYEVYATSPKNPAGMEFQAELDADQTSFQHSDSAEHPDFRYGYLVLALDASGEKIAFLAQQASVSDLSK